MNSNGKSMHLNRGSLFPDMRNKLQSIMCSYSVWRYALIVFDRVNCHAASFGTHLLFILSGTCTCTCIRHGWLWLLLSRSFAIMVPSNWLEQVNSVP